jgi:hypothetical protein
MIIFSRSGAPSGRGVHEHALYARIFIYKLIFKKGIDCTFFPLDAVTVEKSRMRLASRSLARRLYSPYY